MTEWLLLAALLVLPVVIAAIVIWSERAASKKRAKAAILRFSIGGSPLFVSRQALVYLLTVGITFYWYTNFIPFLGLLVLPFLILASLWAVRHRVAEPDEPLAPRIEQALKRAVLLEQELAAMKSDLDALSNDFRARRIELAQNDALAASLQTSINSKLKEYDTWRKLGDQEKKIFVDAAREAVRRRTLPQLIGAAILAIAINIVATVIWTLVGSPGREDLLWIWTQIGDVAR